MNLIKLAVFSEAQGLTVDQMKYVAKKYGVRLMHSRTEPGVWEDDLPRLQAAADIQRQIIELVQRKFEAKKSANALYQTTASMIDREIQRLTNKKI